MSRVILGRNPQQRVRNCRLIATNHATDEIQVILTRLEGEDIATRQVLGINFLKSFPPMPDALVGSGSSPHRSRIGSPCPRRDMRSGCICKEPGIGLVVGCEPVRRDDGVRPTVRTVLTNGDRLDLTEPANTKRITATVSTRT